MAESSVEAGVEGEVVDRSALVVSPLKVRELARALGHEGSEHEVAPTVPLTFAVTTMFDAREPTELLQSLGIDSDRALHGQEEYTYHQPLTVGMELDGTVRFMGHDERSGSRGGTIRRFVFETTFVDAAGEIVLLVRRTVLETSTPFGSQP